MSAEDKVKEVLTAFEEFKATNDLRLKEIEKKGSADPVTVEKLAKIESTLSSHEDANQKLTLQAKAAEKAAEEVKALQSALEKVEAKLGRPGAGKDEKEEKGRQYKSAFESYLRKTNNGLTADEAKALNEYKAIVAGNETLGGYYLAPADMAADIIKNVVLQSPVRSIARVTSIGVSSLKLPKRTGTFAAKRVGEVAARGETLGYTTGMVEINAPEMFAEVLISEQMIEDSAFNIEAEMALEFVEQFAVKEGAEFVAGSGTNNQAEGFITSAQVTQVFKSGTATTIADANGQGDGLINVYYGLKTAYAKNAVWTMNRATIGAVRKLKDSTGRYIWVPGVANAAPNTILDAPYVELPDMPDVAAGAFPIAFGDFQKGYRVVDRVLISVLRDPFTQADNGLVKFLARKRVGGAVVQGEAIAKLQVSA